MERRDLLRPYQSHHRRDILVHTAIDELDTVARDQELYGLRSKAGPACRLVRLGSVDAPGLTRDGNDSDAGRSQSRMLGFRIVLGASLLLRYLEVPSPKTGRTAE